MPALLKYLSLCFFVLVHFNLTKKKFLKNFKKINYTMAWNILKIQKYKNDKQIQFKKKYTIFLKNLMKDIYSKSKIFDNDFPKMIILTWKKTSWCYQSRFIHEYVKNF